MEHIQITSKTTFDRIQVDNILKDTNYKYDIYSYNHTLVKQPFEEGFVLIIHDCEEYCELLQKFYANIDYKNLYLRYGNTFINPDCRYINGYMVHVDLVLLTMYYEKHENYKQYSHINKAHKRVFRIQLQKNDLLLFSNEASYHPSLMKMITF